MTSEQPTHPEDGPGGLLGAARIRELAQRHGVRPTKQWGQNFVVDANTVRRIVRTAEVGEADTVVEVGPGLGSLTSCSGIGSAAPPRARSSASRRGPTSASSCRRSSAAPASRPSASRRPAGRSPW